MRDFSNISSLLMIYWYSFLNQMLQYCWLLALLLSLGSEESIDSLYFSYCQQISWWKQNEMIRLVLSVQPKPDSEVRHEHGANFRDALKKSMEKPWVDTSKSFVTPSFRGGHLWPLFFFLGFINGENDIISVKPGSLVLGWAFGPGAARMGGGSVSAADLSPG